MLQHKPRRMMSVLAVFTLGGLAATESMALTAADADLPIGSKIPAISFTHMAELPTNKAKDAFEEDCGHYRKKPQTAGGRLAVQRRWTVTSEAKLGSYDAISFVDQLELATSGVCLVRNGNIAVFDGARLVALAYSKAPSKYSIGQIEARGDRVLLVANGEGPIAPIATIVMNRTGLELTQLPAEEALCSGKARVPNIYGKPIRRARRMLIAAGWKPTPQPPSGAGFGMDVDLRKDGITEVESCSGTGYGFCAFSYDSASGTLSVTTAGEDPRDFVTYYDVACARSGAGRRR